MAPTEATHPRVSVDDRDAETPRLRLAGRLDAETTGAIWHTALAAAEGIGGPRLVVEGSGIEYCDGAGIGLLVRLRRRAREHGQEFEIVGLAEAWARMLELVPEAALAEDTAPDNPREALPVEVGESTMRVLKDTRRLIAFIGELTVALFAVLVRPTRVRWGDTFLIAERAGVDAVPIIGLIGFLLGLIMAFQAAIPMQQFGAEMFVADLVGISLVRELGPLITAIILAGRSGSSFAAEIGTMKVNEEVDALTTMGLDPLRFLAVPRVIAAVAMTPLLTVYANLAGLIGGLVVYVSLGFPMVTYVNQVSGAVDFGDLLGGLFKATCFGLLVAGVGCLRGLETRSGPSAVGLSTTSAVVSGILLIAVADGVFAVIFYALGI